PSAIGRGGADRQVRDAARREVAEEHRAGRLRRRGRQQVHFTRERRLGEEARREARRVVERAAEERRRLGAGNLLVGGGVGDRHDRSVLLEDAALDVAEPPGRLGVVVAVFRRGIGGRRQRGPAPREKWTP